AYGSLQYWLGFSPTLIACPRGAATIVPISGRSGHSATILMVLGPIVGFLGHGYLSVFGALLAELFPSIVRGTAQGFCYNGGRGDCAMGHRMARGSSWSWICNWCNFGDVHCRSRVFPAVAIY